MNQIKDSKKSYARILTSNHFNYYAARLTVVRKNEIYDIKHIVKDDQNKYFI